MTTEEMPQITDLTKGSGGIDTGHRPYDSENTILIQQPGPEFIMSVHVLLNLLNE